MKSLKQKREQLIKQVRSKQRNEIFAKNRQKLYDEYDDTSLISLIFLMIDKDEQEITQESFDDFLQIISEEVLGSSSEQKKINEGISCAVLQRYGSMLSDFEDKIKNCDQTERVVLILQNGKQFDLIRFLIRLQVIQERHLIILDSLLNSSDGKIFKLIKNAMNILQNSNPQNENDLSLILDELIQVLQLKIKIIKQVTYLYFLTVQNVSLSQDEQKIKLKQEQTKMIEQLTEKWMINKLLISVIFTPQFTFVYKKSTFHQSKIKQLFCAYQRQYLTFFVQHQQFLQKICNNSNINCSTQKIIELVFMMFSLLKGKNQNSDIQIGQQNNALDESLILFMNSSVKMIKQTQTKVSNSNQESTQMRNIYPELLKALIDSFIEDRIKVFMRFLNAIQMKGKQTIIESFRFLNKGNENLKESLIVKFLISIEDFEYYDLVIFVELLSIIMSYNQPSIDILFKAPNFQSYYDQKLNFEIILQKKLLRHVSGQIRRRSVWMLSNITGSQEFYFYGLNFIKNFYNQNILQADCSLKQLSKQDALIKESILQVIMNYLSNLRNYREIQELIQFNRDQSKQEGYQSNSNQFQNFTHKQSLFIWIIRSLSSVIQNLANNTVILKQTQKFIQILIYSFFNLLTLQQNHSSNQFKKQRIVLQIMENYSIPKNIETIYHNSETNNQYSTFFTMIQTLLDLIQKAKHQN